MEFGYARVSTSHQNTDRQIEALLEYGIPERRMSRSSKDSENIKGRKSGLRVSVDALGRKAYCSCGYCLSRQYTHTATETKSATYRCRLSKQHRFFGHCYCMNIPK